MSRSKNQYYSHKRIIRLSKRLFIFSGGRCNGKTQLSYDLMEDLRKRGKVVLIIRKYHARSLNVKASRKKLIRRGVSRCHS